jgi:hypothetical protein
VEAGDGTRAAPPGCGAHWLDEGLGLCDKRLLDLAAEHRFGSVAGCFRRVGAPLELRRLAWWGSALADIGCAAGSGCRDEEVLVDAARFYLGVALFDDVVDGAPHRTAALVQPLHPSRLRLKLERPTDPDTQLRCVAPDLELIAALFDRALEGIGRRLDREPGWRREIADMLEAMYLSELGLSGDPLAAKTLPFVLIGHLALRPDETAPRTFFANLAQLLGLWDDWQDLLADGWAKAPNAHLGCPPGEGPPRRLRGLARGLWLTLMGTLPGHEVSRRLTRALEATLESFRALPSAARSKAEALLLQMLGARIGRPALIGQGPGAPARPAS